MLPQIAKEGLADYCDVFCERSYFTKEETFLILTAANKLGIKGKVHAEQLSHNGGIEAGVTCNAISVDHLEYANDNDIALLKNSETMPTILPGAQFFLQLPFPPARQMIDAGLPVAIASDYNPGSAPSGNMNFNVSLACIQYKLTPEEAINAGTINSAYAMGLSDTHGSIAKGKKANVFITKEIPSVSFIPYSFGNSLIETVIVNGKIQTANNN
jgi:imidazolonepropionase